MNELDELETAMAVDELAAPADDVPPEPDLPGPAVRILEVEACPSVSGRSLLTYHLGWRLPFAGADGVGDARTGTDELVLRL